MPVIQIQALPQEEDIEIKKVCEGLSREISKKVRMQY